MAETYNIVVITGPTATGKTALAVELAKRFNGEIISADSRQVYEHLDIGSGKDLAEYGDVPYHLIDIVPPGGEFHLKAFCDLARQTIREISDRGKLPIICGGTALYIHALLKSYDLNGDAPCEDFQLKSLTLGVLYPRIEVRKRIEQRLDARLQNGLIAEIEQLHNVYNMSWEQLEFLGLEYRDVAKFVQKETTFDQMRSTLLCNIRQFAKRQDIFFRKMEKEGVNIYWLERGNSHQAAALISNFLAGIPLPPPEFQLKDHKNPPTRD